MSLFSGLYVGASGLVTNQNALNTTAHNLSNISTTGYTRQQTIQANKNYDTIGQAAVSPKQVGLGVKYADVRAVRDYFLDKAYRQEQGRAEYYTANYNVITEMETLFGELQGVAFQDSLAELTRAVEELKKQPEDATNQGLLTSKAQTFLERAQAVYNGLAGYQDNINIQIKDNIDKINEYGDKIWELNQKIIGIETGGIEKANDLRDARDQLLDELAALGKIAYDEDINGVVTVQFEGVDFVTKDYVHKMGYIKGDEYNSLFAEDIAKGLKNSVDPSFYVPTWPMLKNQEVFSITEDISADKNTDIGALKALYNARGYKRGTYKDLYSAGQTYDEYPGLNNTINIDGKEYVSKLDYATGTHPDITPEYNRYSINATTGKVTLNGIDYYVNDTTGEVRKGSAAGELAGTISDGRVVISGTDYKAEHSGGHYTSLTDDSWSISVATDVDNDHDGRFVINDKTYYIRPDGSVREDSPYGPAVATVGADGKVTLNGHQYVARTNSKGYYSSLNEYNYKYEVSNDGTVTDPDGRVVGTLGISEADSKILYDSKTTRSSVLTVMAEFDNLIRGIVTGMNKILSSDGTAEGAYGDTLLFSRISDTTVPTGTDGWTTANLMINPTVQKTPSTMCNGFQREDGSRDQYRADALVELFSGKYAALNPDNGTPLSFAGYYSALVSENATKGKVYNSVSTNQEAMVQSIDSQRQEVLGVSDSDELTQMIRYQNAYNASSRYINVINSMLETLINAMT